MTGPRRILVVRPDRIGDVVLSTPVLEALRKSFPQAEIHLLVREAVVPAVEHNPNITRLLVYRPDSVHRGARGVLRLAKEIRGFGFDVAVTLQASLPVSLAVAFAGVPRRVGPYSKWFSYLLFNAGARQRRSAVEMHEAEYNLALLEPLGVRVPSRSIGAVVRAGDEARAVAEGFLRAKGLESGKFIIMHPGMGGSALNWPEENYGELAGRLALKGIAVVVTGSAGERSLVERTVRRAMETFGGALLPIHGFWGDLPGGARSGLAEFIGLLARAAVVVAPSTGPLHLASALGRPTVSFYPPIRVQSARRWGPYGDADRNKVLVPVTNCGQDFHCLGPKCPDYFCMEKITVDEAEKNVMELLSGESRARERI